MLGKRLKLMNLIHESLIRKVKSLSKLNPHLSKEKMINLIVSKLLSYGGNDSCNIIIHFGDTLEMEISKIIEQN